MRTKNLTYTLFMALLLTTSCSKKAVDAALAAATPAASDGSQTAAGLAGSGTYCMVLTGTGTNLDGTGATRYLSLTADGTYTYSIYFSNHVGCTTPAVSGGLNIATYTQSGTFAVGGIATSPSTATKITYTATSMIITLRPVSQADAKTDALGTWLNQCTVHPNFSAVADSTHSVAGLTCTNVGGATTLPSFPLTSAAFSNIGYKSGTNLDTGARSDIWSPGALGTTFPSSYTETWGTFQ
ncbi:MAG: hypothetical protein WA160_16920 [Pseudobdellovibrio sp.]